MHGIQGRLRQHVHPSGGPLRAPRRDREERSRWLPVEVADTIATALRGTADQKERMRRQVTQRLEAHRRAVLAKMDRGYDNFVSGRITDEFWTRRSAQWVEERRLVEEELTRLAYSTRDGRVAVDRRENSRTREKAEFLYKTQDSTE